ncbi:MAG: polysaccharide deacetylase family protein [Anaerovorax sp.]|nr:polysaccharide deacetylase family protein [Anaerovorax sp.]
MDPKLKNEAELALSQSNVSEDQIALPIIMYHGLLKDPALQNKFVIDPALFESDLEYLKEKGYTTMFLSDLIQCVKNGSPFPKKPIILTFDDGYYNNYLYAFPLLKKNNMKAVISIIGRYTDEYSEKDSNHPSYSHITWDQINEMIDSDCVEIQNHTYDMHTYNSGRKGSLRKSGESIEAYGIALNTDIGFLQKHIEEKTGTKPNTFTYPFGFFSKNSEEFLKDFGFEATLTCKEKINYISTKKRNPDELYQLNRILRGPNCSSEDFFRKYGIE